MGGTLERGVCLTLFCLLLQPISSEWKVKYPYRFNFTKSARGRIGRSVPPPKKTPLSVKLPSFFCFNGAKSAPF